MWSFDSARLSRCEEGSRVRSTTRADVNPLYLMRNPSLGPVSRPDGNVHPAGCETSFAESLYLLQQPAYDCSLASLSGNNSKPSSHPPCPVSRNLKCKRAIFVQNPSASATPRSIAQGTIVLTTGAHPPLDAKSNL